MAGDPMTQLLMSILGSGSKRPVDPTQPWNPAAGLGGVTAQSPLSDQMQQWSKPGGAPPQGTGPQYQSFPKTADGSPDIMAMKPPSQDGSFGQKLGNAIMPQTMAGKGGASGG